ncbi:MAG TPA: TRAP transporter substrate-binding protein [Firmicutes bacterium]|nr:TRAP transporter substrate-binding protein [Bacillota bacterium]
MKKKLIIALAVLLTVGMLVGVTGCSRGGNNGEVVELTFAHPFPATHHHHTGIIMPFVEEIEEKSNGRVKITVHPGGSITTGTSAIDDITSGAVDMTWTLQGYTAGRFPLTELIEAFDHFQSAEEATETIWGLFEKSEAFREEYSDYKVFNMYVTDIGDVYTANKPIRTPDDLNGVKLRSASPMVDRSLARFGAITAGMPMPDAYDNIDRGVVDGLATGASAIPTYKLHEVLNYATEGMNLYVSPQVMAISWDAWNKLSEEDQKLFETIGGKALSIKSAKLYDELHADGVKAMKEAGMEVHELSPAEKAAFVEKAATVVTEYIAELEAKGLPGQEVYDLMIEIRDSLR